MPFGIEVELVELSETIILAELCNCLPKQASLNRHLLISFSSPPAAAPPTAAVLVLAQGDSAAAGGAGEEEDFGRGAQGRDQPEGQREGRISLHCKNHYISPYVPFTLCFTT